MRLFLLALPAVLASAAFGIVLPSGPLDSYPAPSPDGKTLLFVSNRLGPESIWISKADGSSPRLLIDGAPLGKDPGGPVWSPDGRHIAFAMRPKDAVREDDTDIYVANPDGSNIVRLTRAAGDDSHPHWSADGQRIFFNSARATPDHTAEWSKQWLDIYSTRADGSDVRRHTDCRTICTYPVPSPDGRWIAHRKTIDGPAFDWELKAGLRNSEVVLTAVDGSTTRNLSQSPAYDGWPTWTPDGQWIIFASNRDGSPATGQLYAIKPDEGGLTRLTTGPLSKAQQWPSFDSKTLYFAERVEDERGEFGRIGSIPLALP